MLRTALFLVCLLLGVMLIIGVYEETREKQPMITVKLGDTYGDLRLGERCEFVLPDGSVLYVYRAQAIREVQASKVGGAE